MLILDPFRRKSAHHDAMLSQIAALSEGMQHSVTLNHVNQRRHSSSSAWSQGENECDLADHETP